jgi:EpsI family protein
VKRRVAALLLCAVFTAGAAASLRWGDDVGRLLGTEQLARPLDEAVPKELGGWTGRDEPLTDQERATLLLDGYVRRVYRGPAGETVTLFVSFHGNKERGLQRFYHNPTVCYPAAGWTLDGTRFERITLEDAAAEIPTCRYVFEKSGARMSVLTLFRVNGEFLDESPRNKPFWMLLDRLKPAVDDRPGSMAQVQVITPIQGGDEAAAAAVSERFLRTFGRAVLAAVTVGTAP